MQQTNTAEQTGAMQEITTVEELTELIGAPLERVANKARPSLHSLDVAWLEASAFCVVSTADGDGHCDTSPKGDPAGDLVHVIDDRTIAIAERPGNRRADGYRNILDNPHVGLLFIIAGRQDTLRINGRARLVSDADFFDDLVVKGHRPLLALVVEIDEVFHHCAKAFMRSKLWDPESWRTELVPPRAQIAKELERPEDSLVDLESYYDEYRYAKKLYTT